SQFAMLRGSLSDRNPTRHQNHCPADPRQPVAEPGVKAAASIEWHSGADHAGDGVRLRPRLGRLCDDPATTVDDGGYAAVDRPARSCSHSIRTATAVRWPGTCP